MDGLGEEGYRGSSNTAVGLPTARLPSPPPATDGDDSTAAAAAAAAIPEKRAPSHESSDYGGGGGADGESLGWIEKGQQEDSGRADASRRQSWAGQSAEDLGAGEAEDPLGLRRASSDDRGGGGQQPRQDPDGSVPEGLLMEPGAQRRQNSEGNLLWKREYEHRGEDVPGSAGEGRNSNSGRDDDGGGYGESDLYERDLENAVAMLDNGAEGGGFLLDGEQAKAWRSESFSSSTAGGGGGGCDGEEEEREDPNGSEHDREEMRYAADVREHEGYAGAARIGGTIQGEAGQAMGGAAGANGATSSAWGNVRADAGISRRQFASRGGGGGGYDDGEAGAELVRHGVGGDEGGDVTDRDLQRKHSFAFSETSTGSAGAAKGTGAVRVGAPGQ